jgi:cytochrome c-type biogenesis protein CcmH
VLVARLPRSGWEVTGAALLFGLAGYALQGHPGLAGAPTPAVETRRGRCRAAQGTPADGRGLWQGAQADPGRWADPAGQYRAAADVLAKAAQENPDDADIEVALGNALVGHSEG